MSLRLTSVVGFLLAFLFGTVFACTALGQERTLDELMDEVEDEIALEEDQAGQKESAEGVKTLDELMDEVEEESPGLGLEEDLEQAPREIEAREKASEVSSEAPPGEGGFWWGLVGLLVVMILLGVPLYVLIGSLAMYLLFVGGIFSEFRLLTAIIEQTRALADQPVLLAIPFFVISGAIMTEGDIARRLITFAQSLFGFLPGGLAIAAVFACVFFAAISGSSPVTVIAIGSIMYPALLRQGFPDSFSAGLVTSAGSLGILIPPSIPMIVYAIVDPTGLKDPVGYAISSAGGGDSSVKDLFIAGLGPGLLIGVTLSAYAFYVGAKAGVKTTPFSARRVLTTFRQGVWALNLPILILGGIYSGVFTPTQAAAVAVVYAAVVEIFIHRSLTIEDFPKIFSESALLIGSLLIIMALALGFNLYLDRAKIPEAAVEMILSWNLSIVAFLLIVNLLLLVVGFFMDILSAILILVPLLAPVAFGLGIHPLHMAIIFIVNLEIGYLTPPIGLNLFVASTLFKKSMGEIVRSVVPFTALMVGCLIVVTYVPTVSLGLVSLSKGGDFVVPFAERVRRPEADEGPSGRSGVVDNQESDAAEESGFDSSPATNSPQVNVPPDGQGSAQAGSGEPRVKTLDELMDEVESEDDE